MLFTALQLYMWVKKKNNEKETLIRNDRNATRVSDSVYWFFSSAQWHLSQNTQSAWLRTMLGGTRNIDEAAVKKTWGKEQYKPGRAKER